jgi:anaerobic selenocysteine-containing dehydrogenase
MFYPTSEAFPIQWDILEGNDLCQGSPRSINMNRLGHTLLHEDPGIYGLFVYNSNPAAVLFNQRKVIAGLEREDLFTVVHEQLLTDTTRYADIVLPATTEFEHTDLHYSYFHLSLQLNEPVIEPLGESRPNIDTFNTLAKSMGFQDSCFDDTAIDTINSALGVDSCYLRGITLERLRDEGAIRLNMPGEFHIPYRDLKFYTPSGKIEFYSDKMKGDGYDPLPAHIPIGEGPLTSPDLYEKYPVYLLTPSAKSFLNSNFANIREQGSEEEPILELNSLDAGRRGIKTGDKVRVFNERGECALMASVGDYLKEGVAINKGIWWNSLSPGGCNSNQTTPDRLADMGGGSTYNTNLVQIEKINSPV